VCRMITLDQSIIDRRGIIRIGTASRPTTLSDIPGHPVAKG